MSETVERKDESLQQNTTEDQSSFQDRFSSDIDKLINQTISSRNKKYITPCLIGAAVVLIIIIIVAATKETESIGFLDDDWDTWSSFSECSTTCGQGNQTKKRLCLANKCAGSSQMTQPCPNQPFCHDSWGEWTQLSPCSTSCGFGVQTKSRKCNHPDQQSCMGPTSENKTCYNACIKGCSTSVYKKSDGQFACGINLNGNYTFSQAEEKCRAKGARLPEIKSEQENKDIFDRKPVGIWNGIWLGATDEENESNFKWSSSNAIVNFTKWKEGEPNDHRKNEDCIELTFDTGEWNDVGCNWIIFHTMCEKIIDHNDGHWSDWSAWSSCSATCGSGSIQQRSRDCINLTPSEGIKFCNIGTPFEVKPCINSNPCPINSGGSFLRALKENA